MRPLVLPAGLQPPSGYTIEDCVRVTHGLRSSCENARCLPLNTAARRMTIQSYCTVVTPELGSVGVRAVLRVSDNQSKVLRDQMRSGVIRKQKLIDEFNNVGDEQPLSSASLKTLTLTGDDMNDGAVRESPTPTPQQIVA